jgi:ORF 12 gene product N-terminal
LVKSGRVASRRRRGCGCPGGAGRVWGSWPIPDAAIRAHFAAAILATTSPADLNVSLAEWKQLGLVSVTSTRPDAVVFVVSVRGAQQFRVDLTVDAHGLTQPVTFEAGGITIYGTYTHPGRAAAGTVPAALLIAALGGRPTETTTPG